MLKSIANVSIFVFLFRTYNLCFTLNSIISHSDILITYQTRTSLPSRYDQVFRRYYMGSVNRLGNLYVRVIEWICHQGKDVVSYHEGIHQAASSLRSISRRKVHFTKTTQSNSGFQFSLKYSRWSSQSEVTFKIHIHFAFSEKQYNLLALLPQLWAEIVMILRQLFNIAPDWLLIQSPAVHKPC